MSYWSWESLKQSAEQSLAVVSEQLSQVKDQVSEAASQLEERASEILSEQKRDFDELESESELKRRLKREESRRLKSYYPPWMAIGDTRDESRSDSELSELKRRILEVCRSEGILEVTAPTSEAVFPFELKTALPYANTALAEDSELARTRFELVPRRLSEKQFWRNYFYRVNLIRESMDFTRLNLSEFAALPKPAANSTSSSDKSDPSSSSSSSATTAAVGSDGLASAAPASPRDSLGEGGAEESSSGAGGILGTAVEMIAKSISIPESVGRSAKATASASDTDQSQPTQSSATDGEFEDIANEVNDKDSTNSSFTMVSNSSSKEPSKSALDSTVSAAAASGSSGASAAGPTSSSATSVSSASETGSQPAKEVAEVMMHDDSLLMMDEPDIDHLSAEDQQRLKQELGLSTDEIDQLDLENIDTADVDDADIDQIMGEIEDIP